MDSLKYGEYIKLYFWKVDRKRPWVVVFPGISEYDPGVFISLYSEKLRPLDYNILFVVYNSDKWSPINRLKRFLHLKHSNNECTDLKIAGEEVAAFLNTFNFTRKCYFVAHSKGGISAHAFFEKYPKVIKGVIASCPYDGSLPANKEKASEQLKKKWQLFFYLLTFRGHLVDKQISEPDVLSRLEIPVSDEFKKRVTLLVSSIKHYKPTLNFASLVCYYLHRFKDLRLTPGELRNNDGIVTVESQLACKTDTIKFINSTHSESFFEAIKELDLIIKADNEIQ